MLRNPAHRGRAAFGKTQTTGRRAKPSHPVATAVSATATTRPDACRARAVDQHPRPRAIAEETFELAQARLRENKRYAKRNSREPPVLLKASSSVATADTRAGAHRRAPAKRRLYSYRCIGSDNCRHVACARTGRSAPTNSTRSCGPKSSSSCPTHTDQGRDRTVPEGAADQEPHSPPRRPGARTRAREERR